jgi:hypothetical protein
MKYPETFSPKAFLKARRPERFSDSTTVDATSVDRSLLEYYLHSLTSRSQEVDFEVFARHLCEREICPNLLPHTGPTGGGDSKADSETYPVADELALAWYVGTTGDAASQRWAFAFSAKQAWRGKVIGDVKKIAETGRGYTKAFFVTNQAVADRTRAEVEDALSKKYRLDVRIFDRTWILDRVFSGRHEKLAVSDLKVTALTDQVQTKGPLDTGREQALIEVESRILAAVQEGRLGPSLAANALEAAQLGRSLERPRTQLEGLFARAERLAVGHGTERQQVEVAYQWAWTLYYWLEDYAEFVTQYRVVEDRARGSANVYDVEHLHSLWCSLFGAIRHGKVKSAQVDLPERTRVLKGELLRLKEEPDRPSSSLRAEELLVLVELAEDLAAKKSVGPHLIALERIVRRSAGLVGYPLRTLVQLATELGEKLEGLPEYERLFETIVSVETEREGEVRGALLLLERGTTQLEKDRPLEAIVTLGRVLARLYKHETRHEIVRALYLCGCAYDSVGLPWAARGTLLFAASLATDELWKYGEVTPYQAACFRRLKWVELELARLPHLLAWHELDQLIRGALAERGFERKELLDAEPQFELALSALLIRTDVSALRDYVSVPDVLTSVQLSMPADALLYALGHEQELARLVEGEDDVHEFARKLASIELPTSLPASLLTCDGQRVILKSRVLGCEVTVDCENESPCVEVGESFLACLEGFLATAILRDAVAREPVLTMRVSISELVREPFTVATEHRGGRPHLEVRCASFDAGAVAPDRLQRIQNAIFELAMTALAHTMVFKDLKREMTALLKDERARERAQAFTPTFGTRSNVLGTSPKTMISQWVTKDMQAYAVLRTKPWVKVRTIEHWKRPTMGDGPVPPELLDAGSRTHDQMKTLSLIRLELWDRANWGGALYATDPNHESPPVMALVFRDGNAGFEIFEHWRRELGTVDEQGQLRVSIIRGIDRKHPLAYRIIVGTNPLIGPDDGRNFVLVSRLCTMLPTNPINLQRFLDAYQATGAFMLAPAYSKSPIDGSVVPPFTTRVAIVVRELNVREAWQLRRGEMDHVGIRPGEQPVVPAGAKASRKEKNERKRSRRGRKK